MTPADLLAARRAAEAAARAPTRKIKKHIQREADRVRLQANERGRDNKGGSSAPERKSRNHGDRGDPDDGDDGDDARPLRPLFADGVRFLDRKEVVARVGVSFPCLWNWMREGTFPLPRRLGENRVGWLESEIHRWITTRPVQAYKPVDAA